MGLWARNHFVQLVHGRLVAKPVSRLCCVTLIPAVIRVTNDGGPDTRRWSDSLDLDNICHDVMLDQISLTLRAPEHLTRLVIENAKRKKCPADTINEFELHGSP